MCFNLWGERIEQFNIQEGQEVTISFDIDCREWNGRWFNDIRAWRVEPAEAAPAPVNYAPAPVAEDPGCPADPFASQPSFDNDLPF